MSSTSPSSITLPGPTHTPSQTPLIAGSLTGLIVLLVCLVTLFLLHRRRLFAQRIRQQENYSNKPRSPHPFEDPPPRTTSSSQPHKTLSRPFVGVLSTTCEAVVDDDVNSITRDHQTGLGRSSGTVDEPRPTMHGNEGVLNETLGVPGGDDVHSQTYNMPSNHRRPLDCSDSSDNNNTELAPKSRRVDSGRMEDVEEPAVGSGEPKNGMGLDSSALSPLINGTGRCVDAPPAYESAWAVERRVGAG